MDVRGLDGDGLFDDDVLAGKECFFRDLDVQMGLGADADQVDGFVGEQVFGPFVAFDDLRVEGAGDFAAAVDVAAHVAQFAKATSGDDVADGGEFAGEAGFFGGLVGG